MHLHDTDLPGRADAAHALNKRGIAQLHVAGLELPPAWRRGSIYDHDHLVTRFEKFARIDDKALVRAVAILREELAVATAASAQRRAASALDHLPIECQLLAPTLPFAAVPRKVRFRGTAKNF